MFTIYEFWSLVLMMIFAIAGSGYMLYLCVAAIAEEGIVNMKDRGWKSALVWSVCLILLVLNGVSIIRDHSPYTITVNVVVDQS